MASFFNNLLSLTAASPEVLVYLKDEQQRKHLNVKVSKDKVESLPLFYDGESVSGRVVLRLKDGRKLEFNSIVVELLGVIEYMYDKSNTTTFVDLKQELAATPGVLTHTNSYDFEFPSVEKIYESYSGTHVRLRYFLKVSVTRAVGTPLSKEKELWVHSYRMPPEINSSIKMEVGIEDCLHIEFEYNKNKYHLMDVIVGKIYFILVRVKVRNMEISIIRRETTGLPPNQYNENETLTRYEIMDGTPVKGETIPIRLFLNGFDLTPTFRDVNHRFSVRYYLNLVLVDEENRRYFKQQEITIYREKDLSPTLNDRVENSRSLRTIN